MEDDIANFSKLSLKSERPINVIFVGHVDAGKSTVCGRILVDLGLIDHRTLEKFKETSAEMSRSSWYLSWCMDTNPEERAKGTTTEVGTASIVFKDRKINILDSPGHKQYITSMISAASRADVGVLTVSARTGEFESGFNGGQTKEHILLLKIANVSHLIVLVNKMDEVGWSSERYNEIKSKITHFAKKLFPNAFFIPANGLNGENCVTRRDCGDFYSGPSLLEYLEDLTLLETTAGGPHIVIIEKLKTSGSLLFYVKCVSGNFKVGSPVITLPGCKTTRISAILDDEDIETQEMMQGDIYKLRLEGNADDVNVGSKLVASENTAFTVSSQVIASLTIIDVKGAFTVGYTPIIHLGLQEVGCKILGLVTKEKKKVCVARKGDKIKAKISFEAPVVLLSDFQLGQGERFSLRDKKATVAFGVVEKVL